MRTVLHLNFEYEHYLADGMAENAALMKSDSVDGSLDARPLETVETPPAIRPSALEHRSMLEPLEPPPPDKDGIWKVPLCVSHKYSLHWVLRPPSVRGVEVAKASAAAKARVRA